MHRVLFVDDDVASHLLFKQFLKKLPEVVCVSNGEEGLQLLKERDDFKVIISDYDMPLMNGIEFLSKAKEVRPQVVRILLSGRADLQVAVEAVNECDVFRLLTKPCSAKVLKIALRDAFEHHRVITSEKELMNKTVRSVIHLISDVTSLLKPERYTRTARILPLVKALCRKFSEADRWSTEVAAVLSVVGFIFLPDSLMAKVEDGAVLSGSDYKTYLQHTRYSSKLISGIPRFENVATILSLQEANCVQDQRDGGFSGDEVPLGSRILKVVSDYDRLSLGGRPKGEVLSMLKRRADRYDQNVLNGLIDILGDDATYYLREVYPLGLERGMILAQDVFGDIKGQRVKFLAKGQKLSDAMIDYIYKNSESIMDITQKIVIRENLVIETAVDGGDLM
ncbi:Response regulator c-di-GMP phosphodiesterase, RpfG family, contains REC and HD-GYP domains [Maridesulfovibrio ferrireducens]|uniref:Response regulator c-di-GMP phosphodiesterase, RpfG family, contains REC and HD-GYP domains n=1 Tax=Maridesulfovibrio ferrireducens TaxID=246191 RepID=A0A1G9LRL1_9BACT|nr:HD domain-containing phosphohydrolase [Maridesulfovibrio ferrireducens]SDL64391.1 Response regulator c-di-GMP phosphodiesterase, RpfG family, contains REC and HD-GYP domains [Maridesulfovibrio ferrireducens]